MSDALFSTIRDRMFDADAKTVTLDTSVLGIAAVEQLFSQLFGQTTLTVRRVRSGVKPLDSGGASFSGSANIFHLPKVTSQFDFVNVGGSKVLVLTVPLPAGWTLDSSFKTLAGTALESISLLEKKGSPSVLLAVSDRFQDPTRSVTLSPGLNFYGYLDPESGPLRQVQWMHPSAGSNAALGKISPAEKTLPEIDIQVAEDEVPGLFDKKKLTVKTSLVTETGTGYPQAGVLVSSDVELGGQPVTASALLWSDRMGIAQLDVDTDLPLPGPKELLDWFGDDRIGKSLPGNFHGGSGVTLSQLRFGIGLGRKRLEYAGLTLQALKGKELEILPKIVSIGDLHFDLNVMDPMSEENRSANILLRGSVDVAGVPFDVSASLPKLVVNASLREGSTLNLTQVVDHFTQSQWKAPDVVIEEMRFRVTGPPVSGYTISAEMAAMVIELGHRQLTLEGVGFEMNHCASGTTGTIHGGIAVGDFHFFVTADHPEAGGGWQFNGKLEDPLELVKLVDELLPDDITLPKQLQSVSIADMQLDWNTDTEEFKIGGDASAKWSLPIAKSKQELDLHFSVQSVVEPAGKEAEEPVGLQLGQSTSEAAAAAIEGDDKSKVDETSEAESDSIPSQQSKPKRTTSGNLSAQLKIGKLTFGIAYEFSPESKRFTGSMTGKETIHITELVNEIGPFFAVDTKVHPAIDDVTFSDLTVAFDIETHEFHFSGEADFDLIDGKQTRITIRIALTKDQGKYDKSFHGQIRIGSVDFELDFEETAGEKRLAGSWKKEGSDALHLATLGEAIGIESPSDLPLHIELGLKEAAFDWEISNDSFAVGAKTTKYGEAFFGGGKVEGTWGFVFGVAVDHEALETIDGLRKLEEIDFLPLDGICLLFATRKTKKFHLPPMPMFSGGFPIIGGHPMDLQVGLTLAIAADLKQAGSSQGEHAGRFKNLHSIAGQDQVVFRIDIGKPFVLNRLDALLAGSVNVFDKLSLSDCQLSITIGQELGLIVAGTVDVPIEHVTLEATGRLAIEETEAECAFEITASSTESGQPTALPIPMGLKGVKLDEIGVEMGVNFEPPGVNFGLEGKFQIGDQPFGANEFAFVFEIVAPPPGEPIPLPDPLLLSLFIEQLSVETAIIAVSGHRDENVPAFLQDISIENLWLYWCEEPVVLPDGTLSTPGFGFNGFVDIYGWHAHARLEASSVAGVSGEAQMDPIELKKVVKLAGVNTPAIELLEQKVNGQWVPIKDQPRHLEKVEGQYRPVRDSSLEIRNRQVIKANGPQFGFSSSHSPYLNASVEVALFSLTSSMHLEVTNHGFNFDFLVQLADFARAHLNCSLAGSSFSADAEFSLHLPEFSVSILGHDFDINLHAGIDLEMDLKVTPHEFEMGLQGEFYFEGLHLTMPRFQIDVEFTSLEQLPGKIVAHLVENSAEIFADLVQLVGKVLDEGVDAAAHVVEEGTQAAAAIVQEADQQADKALDEAKRAIESNEREIKQMAEAADREADKLRREGHVAEAAILEAGSKVVEGIALEIDHVEEVVIADVKKIIDGAARVITAVAKEISKVVEEAAQVVKKIIDGAVKVVAEIAKAAAEAVKQVFAAAEKAIKAMLDEAGRILDEIGRAIAHAAKAVWNVVKHY